MMLKALVRTDRPAFVGGYANGQPIFYNEYRLPADVLRAVGVGVSGAIYAFPVGSGQPVVRCERWGDGWAGVAVFAQE